MKNRAFAFLLAVILVFFAALPLYADALLSNNIAYAGTVPVIDASLVPDPSYADTVVMYIKSTLLDDYVNDDLSSASCSCYILWKDGKLYIHLVAKNVASGDKVTLFFDLDNSDAASYGTGKTASIEFLLTGSSLSVASVGDVSSDADTHSFTESMVSAYNLSSENVACIELCLDFSMLYNGFSFADGTRAGFELMLTDNIDSVSNTKVRYVWDDDTGEFLALPSALGTLVFTGGRGSEASVSQDGKDSTDMKNPGTSDLCYPVMLAVCLLCAPVSLALLRKRS